jgi:hypothetical protein
MKRAQACKIGAAAFQSHKITNNFLHAGGIKYLRYGIVRDQGFGEWFRICKITKKKEVVEESDLGNCGIMFDA